MAQRSLIPAPAATAGFTLIELMVTLSIAAILLALGAPSFVQLIHGQKVTTAANDLFAALRLARSEAIARGTRVDLVPAGGGAEWHEGWLVFIDENDNQKPDAGEKILFAHDPIPADIDIAVKLTDSKLQYVAYGGTGRTRTNASRETPQIGSFLFSWNQQQARKVIISFLGRVRVCNPGADGNAC